MTARDVLAGCAVALTIVAAPGLAEALGTALTGVPTFSTPAQVGEAAPVWIKPRIAVREASRSRQPARTGTLNWHALAQCESSGNPRAISPSGKYRGLYQFSLTSWRFVGMTGDPIDYPARAQLDAARRLYAIQGRAAWPTCGKRL